MVVPLGVNIRLDRLLASELGMSRSLLQALYGGAKLLTVPSRKDTLRRPPKDGLRITLDLSDETARRSVCTLASR